MCISSRCYGLLLGFLSLTVSAKTELIVYSDIETDMLTKYGKAFHQEHPDIRIKWVRDSAGPIAARLLAEKESPKADVIFGLTLSSLLPLEPHGLLESYQPSDFSLVSPLMKDSRTNPLWIGVNAWTSNFCVNNKVLEKQGIPIPKTWQDLTKSEYKGQLIMPNPISSGTGYMGIITWLQVMGNEKAWQYMSDLHVNMKMYTHSGCKPCQMAAQGEIAIGISSGICATPYLNKAAPLTVVTPTDGVGWEIEAVALVKNSSNKDAARKLIDFAVSEQASRIAIENDYIPNRFEFSTDKLKTTQDQLVNVDFAKSIGEKEHTLAIWRSRFDNNQ